MMRGKGFGLGLLAMGATACLGDLNPSSECQLSEFKCEGEVAAVCAPEQGGGKIGVSTANAWRRTDCKARGMVCTTGTSTAGCVVDKKPCDAKTFLASCAGSDLVTCTGLGGSDATNFPTKVSCGDGTCKTGKIQAECSFYDKAAPCEPGKVACDGGSRVECNAATGLSRKVACGQQEVCVSQGELAFCAGSDQPCPTAGAIQCATSFGVYECSAPLPGSSTLYWLLKTGCAQAHDCAEAGANSACVADTKPCSPAGATKCLDTSTLLHCAALAAGASETYWVDKENCGQSGLSCQSSGAGAACAN